MGTFVVYHVRLGNSITVFLQGPQGYREASARAIEEIPAVYSQMIRSLITGQPMNTTNNTVDRNNVTAQQQAPNRVQADSLWYFRLGYGGATGPVTNTGPGFGFGYRYELDSLAIDLSFLNLLIFGNDDPNSSEAGVTGSWVKLMGLYFFNPHGNASLYLGGGVGYGVTAARPTSTSSYTGSGLQGEVGAGLRVPARQHDPHLRRARRDAALLRRLPGAYGSDRHVDKSYVPSFVASMGIGWGRGLGLVRVHAVP